MRGGVDGIPRNGMGDLEMEKDEIRMFSSGKGSKELFQINRNRSLA